MKICEFHKKRILKIGLFHWIKELFKSNQIWRSRFPVCIKSFVCLQLEDANKNLVQTEMMPTMPKLARFFGFPNKFENLAEAKRKLKNLFPDADSVVFLSSRPNLTGLDGLINFTEKIE